MAARLEGLSTGEDVILSDAAYADPEVADMLADPRQRLSATPFEMMLKGFDEENFDLWRITRRDEG
jgi:class 3 adenylate cyclase